MKFGKRLRELVQESDEEWRPNFMDYKVLKKSIMAKTNVNDQSQSNSESQSQSQSQSFSVSQIVPKSSLVGTTETLNLTEGNDSCKGKGLHTQSQHEKLTNTANPSTEAIITDPNPTSNPIPIANTSNNIHRKRERTHHVLHVLKESMAKAEGASSRMHDTLLVDVSDSNDNGGKEAGSVVDTHGRNKSAVNQVERLHSEFFSLFGREVEKVNDFFLDKEEDFIIAHQQLKQRVEQLKLSPSVSRREVNILRSRLTNLHGELVVLEKFSTVNYTGFRKILKKHDKKTGLSTQYSYLNTVLITPFFLSDTVRRLIVSIEDLLDELDEYVKHIVEFVNDTNPDTVPTREPAPTEKENDSFATSISSRGMLIESSRGANSHRV